VCQLEHPGEGAEGASVVVDMHGVAIPNYFLLNILQLVFMVMFNDICMITVAWDNVRQSRTPKRWGLPASPRTPTLPASPPTLTPTLFRTRTRALTLILARALTRPLTRPPTPTPTRWDLPRLYALAGSMSLVVTAAQLLFLGIGFAAMRPAAQQPDRLNLFWCVAHS